MPSLILVPAADGRLIGATQLALSGVTFELGRGPEDPFISAALRTNLQSERPLQIIVILNGTQWNEESLQPSPLGPSVRSGYSAAMDAGWKIILEQVAYTRYRK